MATLLALTHSQQDARMRVGRFTRTLYEAEQGDQMERQFTAYRDLQARQAGAAA